MSNFTGVTFAQQKVLPSDDAVIRRSILSDGVLYGCDLTYSGSTLTMGAGQMLICGRQIRHPSAQNWAVTDRISGYARLVLTVDLTRTSTKDVFEQVVDSIEYATSLNGFTALRQSDVNTSGSVYQVAACVVSLGTGGITGIVRRLGPCEISGGGLNFKVVGGLTQPADPTENAFWVKTDADITGYAFSAKQPGSPANGMVWIPTNVSSPAEFNALKKNTITVCPVGALQYLDGVWQEKDAKIYRSGKWVDVKQPILYLYNNGTVSEAAGSVATDGQNAFTLNPGTLSVYSIGNYAWGHVYFTKPVDLTAYDTLTLVGSMTATPLADYRGEIIFGAFPSLEAEPAAGISGTLAQGTHTVDVSSLSGKFYISFYLKGFDANQIEGGVAKAEASQIYLTAGDIVGGDTGGDSGGDNGSGGSGDTIPDAATAEFGRVKDVETAPNGKAYYNGVLLPEIPADVLAQYPYAWIRKNNTSGYYDLALSNKAFYYNSSVIYEGNSATGLPWYRVAIDSAENATGWTDNTSANTYSSWGLDSARTVLWSNHDIPNGSATATDIYFKGSEPAKEVISGYGDFVDVADKYASPSEIFNEIAHLIQLEKSSYELVSGLEIYNFIGERVSADGSMFETTATGIIPNVPKGFANSTFAIAFESSASGSLS